MLSLAADSITLAGRRLITVVDEPAHEPARHRPVPGVAVTICAGRTVLTGTPDSLGRSVGADRLTAILGTPRLVDDTDLHAPFVQPAERAHLDLSMCGILAGARASRGGRAGASWADDSARYILLLTGPSRTPLHHVALPVTHAAFADRDLGEGRYPGWLTWAEMIRYRPAPT